MPRAAKTGLSVLSSDHFVWLMKCERSIGAVSLVSGCLLFDYSVFSTGCNPASASMRIFVFQFIYADC
jgi:hypothetical protein